MDEEAAGREQKRRSATGMMAPAPSPTCSTTASGGLTVVGRSQVSKTFDSKEQFIGEVLRPIGARISQPFRPVAVRGVYADGDTVVVLWDGEGTRRDGKPSRTPTRGL